MADQTIFFTGYPGFLGSELLPRVLRRNPDATAVCLVQDKFLDTAEEKAQALMAAEPGLAGRIRMVVGDITKADLGLGEAYEELTGSTTEIYHLAAVYDLSVPRDLAMRINVDGTRFVCDFAEKCDDLSRLQYVSTCYVSGRYTGIYREDELVKRGQHFNNFYEETKHLAEAVVRERMEAGLKATIYRPAVVAGNSVTGATQKFDGVYFMIRWILKQPDFAAAVPMIGDPTMVRFNVVPADYVVDAITELSGRDDTEGLCFAIADPEPYTIEEMIDQIGEAAGKRLVKIPLPLGAAKAAIDKVPGVMPLMGIPSSAANYFVHPTHYDTRNTTTHLAGTGILDWDREAWFRALVDFTSKNMDTTSEAMI